MTTLYCYANNEITPIEKAGVPVSDLLVQRGYGIFDFLRVAYYQPLFIDDHLDRFFNSASVMRLTIPESKEEIKKIVATLIQKNNLDSAEIISKWLYESITGYPLDYEGTFWERIKFSF